MSATAIDSDTDHRLKATLVDTKLEVITLPASDLDRAKEFYESLDWRLDADLSRGQDRVIQFTPPGSHCSVHFRTRITPATTGSIQNLYLVVTDIQAARDDLVRRGVEVSEVFHYADGAAPFGSPVRGLAAEHLSYGSYASFTDLDGNGWLLQEVTTRLPGRVDPTATSFTSMNDLAAALRRAAAAHEEHERRAGHGDLHWPEWYAAYMLAEQGGAELPT